MADIDNSLHQLKLKNLMKKELLMEKLTLHMNRCLLLGGLLIRFSPSKNLRKPSIWCMTSKPSLSSSD